MGDHRIDHISVSESDAVAVPLGTSTMRHLDSVIRDLSAELDRLAARVAALEEAGDALRDDMVCFCDGADGVREQQCPPCQATDRWNGVRDA